MPALPPVAQPAFADAYALQKQGAFHQAAKAYLAIANAEPANASAWNNLGNCLRSIGALEDSTHCLRRAVTLSPRNHGYRFNLSLTLLARGDYAAAWPEFESRLQVIPHGEDIRSAAPAWRGSPLPDSETLLVYGNQGLGDELQCLRYLPRILSLAPRVVLEVQAPLSPLLAGLAGSATVITRGDARPEFHHQAEWFSLPGIFGTTAEAIPAPVSPAFESDPAITAEISRLRSAFPDRLHIGLVWSGSPHNDLNPYRACGLEHMRPLLEVAGCHFHSLQLGPPRADLDRVTNPSLTDLAPWLTDLRATATAIQALDLVITTDTSVPHLAGTLGASAWLLLHEPADWRWQLARDHCPWYPSLRLFRQIRPRNWPDLMAIVKSELEALANPI